MKKLLFLLLPAICITQSAFSQYNFHRFSVGLGGGANRPFSDVTENLWSPGVILNYDFYLTPFLVAGLEGQFGHLKGGSRTENAHLREFDNRFMGAQLHAKVALGEILNYNRPSLLNTFKGLFIGSGVGMINNKMVFVTREKPDGSGYIFPGKDKGINLVVPAMVGISFNFVDGWGETRYILTAAYQMNVTFGEGMDGFNDPPSRFENNNNDMYSFATLGLKYAFGRKGVFYKPFRY